MEASETWRATAPKSGGDSIGAACVDTIRAAMAAAGINASGRTSNSLGFKESAYDLEVFAEGSHAPIFTLQNGNKPTPQGGNGFLPAIIQWVEDKGLPVSPRGDETPERALRRTASAIYWSIWRNGTGRYRQPRADIYTPALDKAVADFAERVGDAIANFVMPAKR